jgi:hypothetical protein
MTTLRIGERAQQGNVHLETIRCAVSECPILESLDSPNPS